MSDELIEKYGYPPLTEEIKEQIFGLNAAKLFGVDPAAKRQAIETDKLSALRRDYSRDPWPTNTQYGWVWQDEAGREPEAPVGPA